MTSKVKIKKIYDLERGMKRDGSGEWCSRVMVLEDAGNLNPDERPVKCFGSDAENFPWHVGDIVIASWRERAPEFNGRVYQENTLVDMRNA